MERYEIRPHLWRHIIICGERTKNFKHECGILSSKLNFIDKFYKFLQNIYDTFSDVTKSIVSITEYV